MTVVPALPDVADQLVLLLRATLLMGAAWAAATVLRKAGASAAARHMAWLLGIAALLALPLLWGLVPALRLPILPAEAATAAAASAPATAPSQSFLTGPLSPDLPFQPGWSLVLLAIYALGTAVLLLRLVVGRRMLRRLWSDAGTVRDPAWERLLALLSSEMGLSRRVALRIARGPAVPMTWGTLAPKVLLPAEAFEWPPERRRLVLLHELAHVARRDSFSRSAASLACALYWFHPGIWFSARQMRMEQEHAADDHVLMAGGSPQAYALSLLHLARGQGARPRLDQAAAMAGMYQLERRLVSITSAARRTRPGAFFLSSSALLAGLTTLLVAAGVPVSASAGLGPFRTGPADRTSLLEEDVDSRRAEQLGGKGSRAPVVRGHAAGPSPDEDAIASQSRPTAREMAEGRPPRRNAAAPSGSEPAYPAGEGSRDGRRPALAQQLRDYGWELPRRDTDVQLGSSEASSRPARIILPTRFYPASNERTGSPRWARNVPRLVRGRPPTGSPDSAQGPLVLSWSLEVGGK